MVRYYGVFVIVRFVIVGCHCRSIKGTCGLMTSSNIVVLRVGKNKKEKSTILNEVCARNVADPAVLTSQHFSTNQIMQDFVHKWYSC